MDDARDEDSKTDCYAAAAGVCLHAFSKRVRNIRPDSLVMMHFNARNGVVFVWSEIATDERYRWSQTFEIDHFEMSSQQVVEMLWIAWVNQVKKRYFRDNRFEHSN